MSTTSRWRQYAGILKRCETYLYEFGQASAVAHIPGIVWSEEERQLIQQCEEEWLECANEDEYARERDEEGDDIHMSGSDAIFLTWCYIQACNSPSMLVESPLDSTNNLKRIKLRLMRHTPETQAHFMSDAEFNRITHSIIQHVVLKVTDENNNNNNESKSVDPIDDELRLMKSYDVPVVSSTSSSSSSSSSVAPEEEVGKLWSSKNSKYIETNVTAWIELGARLVRMHLQEKAVARLIRIEDVDVQHETPWLRSKGSWLTRFDAWLADLMQLSAGEDFARSFRDLLYRVMLPIGARSQAMRRTETQAHLDLPSQLFQNECGLDSANFLQTISMKTPRQIAVACESSNCTAVIRFIREWMILELFSQFQRNMIGIQFIKHNVILSCDWETGVKFSAAKERLTQQSVDSVPRPFVLYTQRKWFVVETNAAASAAAAAATQCDNVSEVLCLWMFLIVNKHQGTLADGLDVGKLWKGTFC